MPADVFTQRAIEARRAEAEARRAHVVESTRAARAQAPAPRNEPPTLDERLWQAGGYWAGIFVLWVAFIAPNVYVASRLLGS